MEENKNVDTIKEKYKRIVCRFVNGMVADAEYSITELSNEDFESLKTIFDNYRIDKELSTWADIKEFYKARYDHLESMKTVKSKDDTPDMCRT